MKEGKQFLENNQAIDKCSHQVSEFMVAVETILRFLWESNSRNTKRKRGIRESPNFCL